jgi:predicted MFS family arabinose efflux permease
MISGSDGFAAATMHMPARPAEVALRGFVIGLMAFLTVVDLFATQAILPSLTRAYGVSPAAMGLAVNACTFGMAFTGLAVVFFSHRISHRWGITGSLLLLSIPTALLGLMPSLAVFAILRVVQGVFMATAFTLTLTYLGEACTAEAASGAFAAYITGNVASNLIGRLLSAALADHLGLSWNFFGFALLNLTGAVLAATTIHRTMRNVPGASRPSSLAIWMEHLANPPLRFAFGIGFCILFAFLGTFTYVNFVLVGPPFGIGAMTLGFVYFVFLPSIFTTPLAGRLVARSGRRRALLVSLAAAMVGLPLLVVPLLTAVLSGLILVSVGTFLAQAIATGIVGRVAATERAAASGMYLFAYYLGGLTGTAILGQVYQHLGWTACVAGIGAALIAAALLASRLGARAAV